MLPHVGPPELINGGDASVFEAGKGLGLAVKHPYLGVVDTITTADDLEGYGSPRVLLFRFIHDTHATFSEDANDAVRANCLRSRGWCG